MERVDFEQNPVPVCILPPILDAKVITAVAVNPGDFLNCRNASRKTASVRFLCLARTCSFRLMHPLFRIHTGDEPYR
jgi:hypothetical protein